LIHLNPPVTRSCPRSDDHQNASMVMLLSRVLPQGSVFRSLDLLRRIFSILLLVSDLFGAMSPFHTAKALQMHPIHNDDQAGDRDRQEGDASAGPCIGASSMTSSSSTSTRPILLNTEGQGAAGAPASMLADRSANVLSGSASQQESASQQFQTPDEMSQHATTPSAFSPTPGPISSAA
ncbi:unnamed protein product, partial [Amoebophrya sp. A25]